MTQVELKDSKGNECQLNDIIVVHNPNELVKFFGVLIFENWRFFLSDMGGERQHLPVISWQSLERLGTLSESPGIEKELGRVEVLNENEFDKIFNLIK